MNKNELLSHFRVALLAPENRVKFDQRLEYAPSEAGIYGVFSEGTLIYVGESGCVQKRMGDIGNTRKHTLRRTIGADLFMSLSDYQAATSKNKFPERIESLLNEHFSQLEMSFVPVDFGRTETEEYLVEELEPKYNKKKKRKFT
ncbi:TPA: GIY-YIG nuclease family protein [Vibrio diabolicus]